MGYVRFFAAYTMFGVLTSWAPNAMAQVYRCVVNGEAAFSDRPCPGGDSVAVRVPAPAAQSRIKLDVVTDHYAVNGADFRAALASVRQRGPQGFAGLARWSVRYKYQTQSAAGFCRITDATIHVTGKILMPRWEDKARAPATEQARWSRMYTDLKRHEDGHIQYGREFAVLFQERLLGIGQVPCSTLDAQAQRVFDQLMKNLKFRDAEYDRRTEHGLRQANPL